MPSPSKSTWSTLEEIPRSCLPASHDRALRTARVEISPQGPLLGRGPKILAGALQFLITILLLRRFDPARFGILTVCLSGILLIDSVIGGATDSGVLRLAPMRNQREPQRSVQLQQAGFTLKLIFAAAIALPVLLLRSRLSQFLFQTRQGASCLDVSLAALIGMLVLRSAQMHYQVNRRFVPYGVSDLLSSLLKYGGVGLLL